MRTLFQKAERSILIGLIDTWKDDSSIFEQVDSIHILKVPFDPPSDPYYLARTSGMANNFEHYSLPLAIHTINTLIGRAISANPDISISLIDEKLVTMTWGQMIQKEFL